MPDIVAELDPLRGEFPDFTGFCPMADSTSLIGILGSGPATNRMTVTLPRQTIQRICKGEDALTVGREVLERASKNLSEYLRT